jgi:hypothetical protein
MHEGILYSIASGCWISPVARSIFLENEIDGVMLDPPFSVIKGYVTAILMAVMKNVGIPVAFAFGWKESIGLDNDIYENILESDHGSALNAIASRHRRHLFCLRHFIKSLKQSRFCEPVATLVRSRTRKEVDFLSQIYQPEFQAAINGCREVKLDLMRCLNKVGL